MDEIINELRNKYVDIENEYHETKDERLIDVKIFNWEDTKVSISKDKEYDYFNLPVDNGCLLGFLSVKFKKLSEEAITFLLENRDEAHCTYTKKDSNETTKAFWFIGPKVDKAIIYTNV